MCVRLHEAKSAQFKVVKVFTFAMLSRNSLAHSPCFQDDLLKLAFKLNETVLLHDEPL